MLDQPALLALLEALAAELAAAGVRGEMFITKPPSEWRPSAA